MMRLFSVIALLFGLSWWPAHSQTLLEDVLYVVSGFETGKNHGSVRPSVSQDSDSLQFEIDGRKLQASFAITIKRVNACRFEIERNSTVFSERSVIDFTKSDFEGAHLTKARNFSGRLRDAISIPGTRYCLAHGEPFFNTIPAGTCVDKFYADFAVGAGLQGVEKMLATIRRLRTHCVPELS